MALISVKMRRCVLSLKVGVTASFCIAGSIPALATNQKPRLTRRGKKNDIETTKQTEPVTVTGKK